MGKGKKDVGLGTGVRGGGSVRTLDARASVSGARSQPVHRVWQLPNQWCVHIGSLHHLLVSNLHLPLSYWCPCLHRILI